MKKMSRIVSAVFIAAAFLAACNKPANKLAKYIPKDANAVFLVNSKSIFDKVNKAGISLDSLAHMMAESDLEDTAGQTAGTKLEELKQAGIDFDQASYGFVKTGGSIMAGQSTSGAFIFAIKDAAAFEKFLKTKNPGKDIKKGENYSYLALGDDFIAGWTDNVGILAMKHGGTSSPGTYATGEGTLTQQMLTAMFAQKESESIVSSEGFGEMKQNVDFAFYSSTSGMQGMSMLGLTKLAELTEGSYSTGTIDFQDGKVAASFTFHANKALGDMFKKYPLKAIDISMLDKYPAQIQGFMIGSVDPQLFPAIIKFAGFDQLADDGIKKMGFTLGIADIFKALKGDIAIIGSDFGMQTKTITEAGGYKLPQPVTTNVPTYKALVNIGINKAEYTKLAEALAQKGWLTVKDGQYQSDIFSSIGLSMVTTDNNLYIASSDDLVKQYTANTGGTANLPADIHNRIKGKSFALYADISKIWASAPPKDSLGNVTDKPLVKDFIMTNDLFKDNTTTGEAELNLADAKENSLVAFLKYAMKESRHRKQWKADSTGVQQ